MGSPSPWELYSPAPTPYAPNLQSPSLSGRLLCRGPAVPNTFPALGLACVFPTLSWAAHPSSPTCHPQEQSSRRTPQCGQLGGMSMEEFRKIHRLAHLSSTRRQASSRPGASVPSLRHAPWAGPRPVAAVTHSAESDRLCSAGSRNKLNLSL